MLQYNHLSFFYQAWYLFIISLFDALWIALLVFIVIIIHTIKGPYCSLLGGGGGCFELLNIAVNIAVNLRVLCIFWQNYNRMKSGMCPAISNDYKSQ